MKIRWFFSTKLQSSNSELESKAGPPELRPHFAVFSSTCNQILEAFNINIYVSLMFNDVYYVFNNVYWIDLILAYGYLKLDSSDSNCWVILENFFEQFIFNTLN